MSILMWLKQYWRETLILLSVVALSFTVAAFRYERNQKNSAQTEIQNAKVEFTTFKNGVVQAQNHLVETHKQMLSQMSSEFQTEIKSQDQRLLMLLKGDMKVGFQEVKDAIGSKDPNLPVYTFQDKVQDIKVDARMPNEPRFSYKIKPFDIHLEGSLNFDEKEGQTKFWFRPQVKNELGLTITTPQLDLTPSPEFNQWVGKLKGREVYVPVMPRWTVSGLAGREWMKELPGGFRNVYGADATYNFRNNLGVGAGFIGSTTFMRVSYSFGK